MARKPATPLPKNFEPNVMVTSEAKYQAFVHAAGMAAIAGDLHDCARYVLAALDVLHFYPEIERRD